MKHIQPSFDLGVMNLPALCASVMIDMLQPGSRIAPTTVLRFGCTRNDFGPLRSPVFGVCGNDDEILDHE